MMRLNVHDLGCDMYSASPHKWLHAPKGSGFLYVRDEVIDRVWNTIATEGWDDTKLRAERFQRIGSSNVPALWGLRASLKSQTTSAWSASSAAIASSPTTFWPRCRNAERNRGHLPIRPCAARSSASTSRQ